MVQFRLFPNYQPEITLTSNENAYRANDRFIDHDIKNVLNTNFNEISKLWEYIITEQPVMIYGKTPNLVTHGSFAAASLCYPEDPCEVIPYISLTDPRFPNLSKSKSCVFGTSNPASLLAVSKTVHVHKIEYENSINGEKLTSAQIRCKLYCNTRRIRKALEKAIDRQIQINFLSVIIGKISSSLIEKSLTEERFIPQTVSLQRFSRLLARSNLCEKIRRERLLTQNALAQYLSLRIPEKLKLSALRKVYISFVNALEIGSMTEANEIVLQNKIREIAPLLHSQL
ncbi:hypothetical protein GPJ56_009789 [Histomonas meleagridis]|nr:hypothetical protein GPJ56_009789 [Histomonas meleagridis]